MGSRRPFGSPKKDGRWRSSKPRRRAGGAVKTQELTLPGFRHDVCAMNLSMFAGSAFFAAHKQALLDQGLGFMPAAKLFRERLS